MEVFFCKFVLTQSTRKGCEFSSRTDVSFPIVLMFNTKIMKIEGTKVVVIPFVGRFDHGYWCCLFVFGVPFITNEGAIKFIG